MITADIGARLRDARRAQGLSLRTLADRLGVSASLISQVETGKTQPSVATLYALVTALGVSIDGLLGVHASTPTPAPAPEEAPRSHGTLMPGTVVQGPTDHAVLLMENGVRWEQLAGGGGPADALLVTYEPGAASSVEDQLMRHTGLEYAYILQGELVLQLDFDRHTLRAGDSLFFDAVRPHMYRNESSAPAQGVWFVLGRREASRQGHGEEHRGEAATSFASALEIMDGSDRMLPHLPAASGRDPRETD